MKLVKAQVREEVRSQVWRKLVYQVGRQPQHMVDQEVVEQTWEGLGYRIQHQIWENSLP